MRIMTWNIENGGALADLYSPDIGNIKKVVDEIENIGADIVVVQEYLSKYKSMFLDNGLIPKGYKYIKVCEDAPDKTLRKRVLVASKLGFDEIDYPAKISRYSRRNWCEIITTIDKIHILGVDVPLAEARNYNGSVKDNHKEKKEFLDAMLQKFIEFEKSKEPSIILGDFNLHSEAVYKEYLKKFSKYLCEITNDDSTWGRNKFDYIYVNEAMKDMLVSKEKCIPIETNYSDHKYLYVDFGIN